MCCKGFVKRIIPFFLTFAVGLFIASFFVSIAAPNFQFKRSNWKRNHRQYDRQMELEIQRLREENMRLKNEAERKFNNLSATFEMNEDGSVKRVKRLEATFDTDELNKLVPPPALTSAPPTMKMKTVPYQEK